MPKFVLRAQEPETQTPIEFWLEQDDDGYISLCAAPQGVEIPVCRYIVTITSCGRLYRNHCINKDLGLQLDGAGRIELDS